MHKANKRQYTLYTLSGPLSLFLSLSNSMPNVGCCSLRSWDGQESAEVGYLAWGLLTFEVGLEVCCVASGISGTTMTVCVWPNAGSVAGMARHSGGGAFRSGFDWTTLASSSLCSLPIWLSRVEFSSLNSFFSTVTF